jgi:hypothetical protein
MEYEKIIFFRNFFFRAFIVGLAFALFYFVATYLFGIPESPGRRISLRLRRKNSGDWFYNFWFNCALSWYFSFLCLPPCIGWL